MDNAPQHNTLPRWLIVTSIGVPVVIILIAVVVVNFPNWTMKMNYDLVYLVCDGPGHPHSNLHNRVTCERYMNERYQVIDGRLNVLDKDVVLQSLFPDYLSLRYTTDKMTRWWQVRVFVHRTRENISVEVSPEELRDKNIITTISDPDGTRLVSERVYHGDPFFFGGSRYTVTRFVRGNGARQADLVVSSISFNNNFKQLGWIER